MTMVLLLRHGEIPQSDPRRFVGQRDLPLTPLGRDQALRWRKVLARAPLDGVWTSDLARCREMTEHALGDHHPVAKPLPALREISLGEWEGLSVAEVQRRFPGEYERRGADLERIAPAGGESFADLRDRVWPALTGILANAGAQAAPLLVVSHAGVIRTLICQALGMPLARVFSLGQQYAALNILRFSPARQPELLALNLPPEAATPLLASLSG